MQFHIETERLILRDLLDSDAKPMFEMDSNIAVHRYLGQTPIHSLEEAIANISFIRQQYEDFNIGRWAVINKERNNFMGWAGLKWITEEINGHRNFYDLGYRLLPQYWGRGIATEAAEASIAYAFSQLNVNQIFAITHIENFTSKHILEKVGFSFIETFKYKDLTCNWLELNKTFADLEKTI